MNKDIVKALKTKYDIDFVDDMLLQHKDHINFYIDMNTPPLTFNILSGDVTKLGFKKTSFISHEDFYPRIILDNAKADVEGKLTFLNDLIHSVETMKDDLYIYLPLLVNGHSTWLYIAFHRILKTKEDLIFGQVLRIFQDTPEEIKNYQKTYQDPLTKLFTRETLKKHFLAMEERKNAYGIYLDIDEFKTINDTFGHLKGDQFLIKLADLFMSTWEKDVIYYRLGGDEFFILVKNHTKEQILKRAENLIYSIENLSEQCKKIGISASIGIVEITDQIKDIYHLLDLGDQYMYVSKRKGKGQISISS